MLLFEAVETACRTKDVRALVALRKDVGQALRNTSSMCYGCGQQLRELRDNINEVLDDLAERKAEAILCDVNTARLEKDFRTAYSLLQQLQPGGLPYLVAAVERSRRLRTLLAAVLWDLRQEWCLCCITPVPRTGTYHSPSARRVLRPQAPRCRRSRKLHMNSI